MASNYFQTPGSNYSNINGIHLTIPNSFEGIVPVSPHVSRFDFEPYTFLGIKSCLRSGDIGFDIGSSYGIMTALMAKWVGRQGMIFSFEANSEVMEKAREIIQTNGLENNVKFNNFVVGDHSDVESDFYVTPGYMSVMSSVNPLVSNEIPNTIKKKIMTMRIDDFCSRNQIYPQFIKMDIEGSEFIAIKGMENLLSSHFPDIILETHYTKINAIGGSLIELMELLSSKGYGFFDLREGDIIQGIDFAKRYENELSHVLVSKKMNQAEYVKNLKDNLTVEIKRIDQKEKIKLSNFEIKKLFELGNYNEVIEKLSLLPLDSDNAEAQYYFAFSLHAIDKRSDEAIIRYNVALKYGYEPFWIFYNRGSLYYKLKNFENARHDLKIAYGLNSNHEGVKNMLTLLENQSKNDTTDKKL